MLQCVAVFCSVLQCVAYLCFAMYYSAAQLHFTTKRYDCDAACCSVLQRVAACYSMLQRIAAYCSVLQRVTTCCSVLQRVAVQQHPAKDVDGVEVYVAVRSKSLQGDAV